MSDARQPDVIVIGAGMAGLAAARVMVEAGRRVVVLEAADRVGGRILTVYDGGTVVELGAEFVHGRPPELWQLIAEAGLETYERTGEFLRRGENGPEPMQDGGDEDDPLNKLENFAGPDCPFAEYVERLGLDEDARQQQMAYVEGFNAADAREASAMALGRQQRVEDAIDGERSWRVREGYARLTDFLHGYIEAGGAEVVLGAAVAKVTWRDERGGRTAEIVCEDGRIWRADKVVVTLPLGILQAGTVRFDPWLPAMLHAASRLRMGHACRFTMLFHKPLWPEGMSFLLTRELLPTVWWTARPQESRSLTGWVGGPRSAPLLALTGDELRAKAIEAAAAALGIGEDEVRAALTGFHTHNWDTDPRSRGAYTWVPVGGLDASLAMCEPVGGTLYFAGEHTDTTGHWGTVHAALRSGLRAGRQVVEAFS
jgi:monoamine oxidase